MKNRFVALLAGCVLLASVSFAMADAPAVPPVAGKPSPSLLKSMPPLAVNPAPKQAPADKAAQVVRIGYADMARISSESELGKSSHAQVKQRQKKLEGQIIARRKQLDRQKKNLEAKMPEYTPQQREAKAKGFQKRVEAFQKFAMSAEKELQQLQERLSKALYESIETAAVEYGRANSLALVVVKRDLLYLASGVDAQDVSAGIVKLMDEKTAKKK